MKDQTILLATSIFIIVGMALLFLGTMTYLDQAGSYYQRDIRNQAYVEIAIGFIFIAVGAVVFLIYGKTQKLRENLK